MFLSFEEKSIHSKHFISSVPRFHIVCWYLLESSEEYATASWAPLAARVSDIKNICIIKLAIYALRPTFPQKINGSAEAIFDDVNTQTLTHKHYNTQRRKNEKVAHVFFTMLVLQPLNTETNKQQQQLFFFFKGRGGCGWAEAEKMELIKCQPPFASQNDSFALMNVVCSLAKEVLSRYYRYMYRTIESHGIFTPGLLHQGNPQTPSTGLWHPSFNHCRI